jgi:Raf kinase inhibitor-like YbhB/YbcL family protein
MRGITVRAGAAITTTVLSASAVGGCGASEKGTRSVPHPTRTTLALSSSAFLDGSRIPARYTCDGEDVSPPLTWTRVPASARSLALLVVDTDAPGGAFVHWSVYDLPPGSSGLATGRVPSGSAEGENSFGRPGYGGPCPPKGNPEHHYVFSLYALDGEPGLPRGATPATVREALTGRAVATATLTGLYSR